MASERRPRRRPEEIARRLAAVSRTVARGVTINAACRANGVSAPTYYRWKREAEASGGGRGAQRGDQTREAVLAAARGVFLRDGFGASLTDVAKAAGVSRQTIYNLFGAHDRLFGEAVQALYEKHIAPVLLLGLGGELTSVLEECARHQIQLMTDPEAVGLLRITLGEYRSHPELAALAYAVRAGSGVSTVTNAIAKRLSEEIARGTIEELDTILAAQTFIGSCTAHLRHRALIGFEPPSPDEVESRIQMAVKLFTRGLGYGRSTP